MTSFKSDYEIGPKLQEEQGKVKSFAKGLLEGRNHEILSPARKINSRKALCLAECLIKQGVQTFYEFQNQASACR